MQIAETGLPAGIPLGQLVQQVERAGAFGLAQGGLNRNNTPLAANVSPRHGQNGSARELLDGADIAFGEGFRRAPGRRAIVSGFAARQHDAGGHPFHVPLPGSADGFVEIVQVEDQLAIRRGERTQVLNMRVPAQLNQQAGMRQAPRSAAMMETAPRKKAKGDVFMRACLSGSRAGSRPRSDARSASIGSKRRAWGRRSACAARLITSRRLLPNWARSLALALVFKCSLLAIRGGSLQDAFILVFVAPALTAGSKERDRGRVRTRVCVMQNAEYPKGRSDRLFRSRLRKSSHSNRAVDVRERLRLETYTSRFRTHTTKVSAPLGFVT